MRPVAQRARAAGGSAPGPRHPAPAPVPSRTSSNPCSMAEVAATELAARCRRPAPARRRLRLRSGVTTASASGTWATAVMTSVGGTLWRSPSAPRYSLFNESLPLTNGARCASDACAAGLHRHDELAERGGPARVAPREVVHQRDASGSAPTATTLRIASSTTAWAMRSGSVIAVPRVDADADRDARARRRVRPARRRRRASRCADADQRTHDGGRRRSRGRSGG